MLPRQTTAAAFFCLAESTTNGSMRPSKTPCTMLMALRMRDRELKRIQVGLRAQLSGLMLLVDVVGREQGKNLEAK